MIRTLVEGLLGDAEHCVACPAGGSYFELFRRMVGAGRVFESAWELRRAAPDLVHTHGFGAGLLGRLANWGSGIPVVHTFHGFYPRGAGVVGGAVRLAAEAVLAPAAKVAVAVSESEKRLVERLCPHLGRRTVVIPNGVRPRTGRSAAVKRGREIRVLVVGRLVYQKHPELAVRIASLCRHLDPALEFEFRLAGSGPLAERVRQEARALGVEDRVRLLGDVTEIGRELEAAHIYLSTARWEGLSMALLEAMHAGLPCVASKVQGNVDAIEDGQTGLLYEPDSPGEAALRIVGLARDAMARRAYGLQARATAEAQFSVASMCRQYLALYRRLTETCAEPAVGAYARTEP